MSPKTKFYLVIVSLTFKLYLTTAYKSSPAGDFYYIVLPHIYNINNTNVANGEHNENCAILLLTKEMKGNIFMGQILIFLVWNVEVNVFVQSTKFLLKKCI